jgi:hypothetical protein
MARTIQPYSWVLVFEWASIADRVKRLLRIWYAALPSSPNAVERVEYRTGMVVRVPVASLYHLNDGIQLGFE